MFYSWDKYLLQLERDTCTKFMDELQRASPKREAIDVNIAAAT